MTFCAERLIRKLDTLPEEKIYQILDYIDFLESKYAPKLSTAPNPLKRFAEGVEDTLRAGRMSAGVIGGTMSVMNKAVGVVTDVANAGKSVATEIAGVVSSVTSPKPARSALHPSPAAQPATQPPGDQRKWRAQSSRASAAASSGSDANARVWHCRRAGATRAGGGRRRTHQDRGETNGDVDHEGAAQFPAAAGGLLADMRVSTTDKLGGGPSPPYSSPPFFLSPPPLITLPWGWP